MIAAAQMGLLVGEDMLRLAAVHVIREIDLGAKDPKHKRRGELLGLINIALQTNSLTNLMPQPQRADQGIQNEHKDTK